MVGGRGSGRAGAAVTVGVRASDSCRSFVDGGEDLPWAQCQTPAPSWSWGPAPPGWRPPWARGRRGGRARGSSAPTRWAGPPPCPVAWCGCRRTAATGAGPPSTTAPRRPSPIWAAVCGRRRRRRAGGGLRVRHRPRHRGDREPDAHRVGGPQALARLPRRASRRQVRGTVVVAAGPAPGTGRRGPRPVRLRPALPDSRLEPTPGGERPPTTAWCSGARSGAGPLSAASWPACVDAGVEVRTGARVTGLVREDGAVGGVRSTER